MALDLFHFQRKENPVYRDFLSYLPIDPSKISEISSIPFLPISAFKHHSVISGTCSPTLTFKSSGTTGLRSQHLVCDPDIYKWSLHEGFHQTFGSPESWCILALLPSYLERNDSSLVYMVNELIRATGHPDSGFYLDQYQNLIDKLQLVLLRNDRKIMLIGVAFALLELAEQHKLDLRKITLVETGGMKNRRKEISREEMHGKLQDAFGVKSVYSEYGMTELLSQAWSKGKGVFTTPPWMKVLLRDINDPLQPSTRQSGAINIIDLANVDSCAFIATDDLGSQVGTDGFTVLGRMDYSDLRGCNLLLE